MASLENRVTKLEVELENNTNRHIQIVAENHGNIIDKLNEAIRAENRNLEYEIKVDALIKRMDRNDEEISKIHKEIADTKNHIA